jgi:hypothetical protein
MGQWFIGKIHLDMEGVNILQDEIPFETNIPIFHHSMCEAKNPSLKNYD